MLFSLESHRKDAQANIFKWISSDVGDTAQIGQPNCDHFKTLRLNCVRQYGC